MSFLNNLSAEILPNDLLKDCWPSDTRLNIPLPDSSVSWLKKFSLRDTYFTKLSIDEQNELFSKTLNIANRIPFFSESGKTLPPEIRLFLSLELGKLTWKVQLEVVCKIKSIVVYSNLKMAKNNEAQGCVIFRGRKIVSSRLRIIKRLLQNILELLDQGYLRAPDKLKNKMDRSLRSIEDVEQALLEGNESVTLIKKFADELVDLFTNSMPLLIRREFSGSETQQVLLAACKEICSLVEPLKMVVPQDTLENEASIHLSWLSLLYCEVLPDQHLLAHEVAHIVDYLYTDHSNELNSKDPIWERYYDAFVTGSYPTIRPYGRKNAQEFFAVCAELFFTDATKLSQCLELEISLQKLFGQRPVKKTPKSSFRFLKNALFSKLNIFRIS